MTQPAGTAKKKILIVDDEKHVVTYLETLLQDNGYDTISASDGKVAMEKGEEREARPRLPGHHHAGAVGHPVLP